MNTLSLLIEALAPHANLTPRAISLLQSFFLHNTTDEEEKELTNWMHESEHNSRLFELLVEFNSNGAGASFMYLLSGGSKKPKRKWYKLGRKTKIWIIVIALPFVIQLLVDAFTGQFRDYTVSAGDETKTIWIPADSTRVDLQPHSTITYPSKFRAWRLVKLTGTARFEVKSAWIGGLWVVTTPFGLTKIKHGVKVVRSDSSVFDVQQSIR
ncbi:hypothetical protein [Flavihumibacter solisilvae]|uniref:Uncharacterized protein n=1 Tax=Flavihumibacter solisilvae TaxID=1349421 RepID=A0A0C1IVZ2_9BACT|nr:hypothetical protein [Flavihumibacter solisilvae]KIC94644.1 hypothetical protein OI18_11195 [Flavihumibacter solisilvae]